MSRNTPSVTRNRTGTVATRRRRISWPTAISGLLEPHAFEPHHAVGDGWIGLHFGTEGFRLDGMNDEDRGGFLAQDLDELAVQLLPLGVVRHLACLFQQLVGLRVGKT